MSAGWGFAGPTYDSRTSWTTERAINLMPETDQGGHAKSKVSLIHTPGLSLFTTLDASPVRGLWVGNNNLYAVGGTAYAEVTSAGVVIPRATVNNDATETRPFANAPAYMFANGTQLLLFSGSKCYCDNGYDGGGAVDFTEVVADARWGGFLGGYFYALQYDAARKANKLILSGLNDGKTAWDALDFSFRGSPDLEVAAVAHDGQLWRFGHECIEVWWHSGNADFPFEPVQGGTLDIGTYWPDTIVSLDRSLFFVDKGGAAWRTRGLQAERITPPGIEAEIRKWLSAEFFVAYGYEEDGHRFYVLTIPGTSGITLAYDTLTGMWHERAKKVGGDWQPAIGRCHALTGPNFYSVAFPDLSAQNLIGARDSAKVYIQSMATHTEEGSVVTRYRRAPHLADENRWMFHHRLRLDLEVGTSTGTPTATLEWSDDKGRTFDGGPIAKALPTTPQKAIEVEWRRLGRTRDRVYGVTLEVNGRVTITDAYLEASGGNGS
jgi:hypothetical protein